MHLLGSILKMGKWFVSEPAEEEFMVDCREYAENSRETGPPPAPVRTFERFWECRCEDDWKISFWLFFWGISSFMALLCTMGFIKFTFDNMIAILFSAIICVFFFIWLGIQVTWGAYLQKAQHDHGTSNALGDRLLYLSSDNPFKWHICPDLRPEQNNIVSNSSNESEEAATGNVPEVGNSTETLPI